MRVALLSAGPSLPQMFDPDAQNDLRVGVNSAAALFHCDWWACGDGVTFARVEPIGYPALFTLSPDDANLKANADRLSQHRVEPWGPLKQRFDSPQCWTNWSLTAGLVLAVDQGASEVYVYGHDFEIAPRSEVTDCVGYSLPKRRDNRDRVIRDWREVRKWAEGRGVPVREIQPEVSECM